MRRQASIDGPLDESFLASPDYREASWYLNRQSKSDDSLVFLDSPLVTSTIVFPARPWTFGGYNMQLPCQIGAFVEGSPPWPNE
jgi:hypothetical protein